MWLKANSLAPPLPCLAVMNTTHEWFLPLIIRPLDTYIQCSQRCGPLPGPTGGLPRALDWTGRQNAVHTRPGNRRTGAFVEEGGPCKVRDSSAGDCGGL